MDRRGIGQGHGGCEIKEKVAIANGSLMAWDKLRKEDSREKAQKAHKHKIFCASCAFSRLFHGIPSKNHGWPMFDIEKWPRKPFNQADVDPLHDPY